MFSYFVMININLLANARFVRLLIAPTMAETEFEAVNIADLVVRCREVCTDDMAESLSKQLHT